MIQFPLPFIKTAPVEKLNQLCFEVRKMIIDTVSHQGGHLSSNLGAVELTVALLKVFDPLLDDILFDVGHQSYSYKILTDRASRFSLLRQENGISGFPDPRESPYDKFVSGHSSTSLAVAAGFSIQKKLFSENSFTIVVFGDGSITGGEAFESLNAIGHHQLPVIAILNDNEMSISPNVGAMAKSFSRFRSSSTYKQIRKSYQTQLQQWGKWGKFIDRIGDKAKSMVKQALFPEMFFEEFGFFYMGPVDGHQIPEMVEMFSRAKTIAKPVLIHVYTQKGKGFHYAENNPVLFHSSPSFVVENECCKPKLSNSTFSNVFGDALYQLGRENSSIVALTAAMQEGLGMCRFSRTFPERFFDFGIAEQHMVSAAAGMAQKGLKPVVGIYSTFLQRAIDQIIHDCAILQEPVVFAIDRAGAVSDDGPTHQGIFDLSLLLPIPNTIIMAPSNGDELTKMLGWATSQTLGPIFIRYPKDIASSETQSQTIALGKSFFVQNGKDISIIFLGPFKELSFEIARLLDQHHLTTRIIDARFAKPFDKDAIILAANETQILVTIEDGCIQGGFGQQIQCFLLQNSIFTPCICFGLPNIFPGTAKRKTILFQSGIDADAIKIKILDSLDKKVIT